MLNLTNIASARQAVREADRAGKIIGLVPTMGNLHDGHLKLVSTAKQQCDWVVATIFVNPLQFGPKEDLAAYPRTLADDMHKLAGYHCDALFQPDSEEIYPHGLASQTIVSVPDLGDAHCGKSRPGHFDGVSTVVAKLFNICQPHKAFFGLKDYQQFLIISRMVTDLQFPVEIIGVETCRETSGLALSSRNNYLTRGQREEAAALYQTLQNTSRSIQQGRQDYRVLEQEARAALKSGGLEPDYFNICHARTLKPAGPEDTELAILAAAMIANTRLIDNVRLTRNTDSVGCN